MPKKRLLWSLLIILLIAAGIAAAVLRRPAASGAGSPAAVVSTAATGIELLPGDLVQVQPRDLRQVLPLTGALRAVNQAAVKARVAGEVRQVLVREGEAVQAGQVLVKMDVTEYRARAAQTEGAMLAARGQLAIATKARDNNKALLGKGFISQNAFDNAASQYDIAQANVESARGALDVSRKGVADTTVRAPIAGLVSNRSVQPGEKVPVDFRLLDIVDLRKMEMEAAVPTGDIQRVALGQEVQLKIEGVARPVAGKVARINPSTQSGSRSIIVYVEIDNPQGMLRAGMFGEAQLTLVRHDAVLTVPVSAVQAVNGQSVVYAVESGVLRQVPVTLGITGDDGQGGAVEIASGLRAGAQVLRNNLGNLVPGTAVSVAGGTVGGATGVAGAGPAASAQPAAATATATATTNPNAAPASAAR